MAMKQPCSVKREYQSLRVASIKILFDILIIVVYCGIIYIIKKHGTIGGSLVIM